MRNLCAALFGILALGGIAAPAGAQTPSPAAVPGGPLPADGYFEIAEKVAEGVWTIRQAKPFHLQPIGNVTVVEHEDGLVLVDSGGSPGSGGRITNLIRGLSPKPVKAVVITHWHGDHPLGLSEIRAAWPKLQVIAAAPTAGHLIGSPMKAYAKGAPDPALEAEFLKRLDGFRPVLEESAADAALTPPERAGYQAALRLFAQYRHDVRGLHLIPPNVTFTNRLVLEDADAPAEVLHLGRGNTDGDAVVWLPKQKVLVTGDLVVAPIPFAFGSYPADWARTLDRLSAYDFAVLVPGHGAPQRDRVYLDRVRALIADVRAQVAPLAAAGRTVEQARAEVDLSRHAALIAGEDPWLRRWFKSYWSDPFVEGAWKEAKGIPIEQGTG